MKGNEKEGKGDTTSTEKSTSRNPPRQLFGVLFIMPINTLRIVCSSLSHFSLSSFPLYFLLSVPFLLSFFLSVRSFICCPPKKIPHSRHTIHVSTSFGTKLGRPHKAPHFYSRPHTFTFLFLTFYL